MALLLVLLGETNRSGLESSVTVHRLVRLGQNILVRANLIVPHSEPLNMGEKSFKTPESYI